MKSTPIRVRIENDASGEPKAFRLEHEKESLLAEPGKSWSKLDIFKWVTRGILEDPQSFHVEPGGDVEINGHAIRLREPGAALLLEAELNRKHAPAVHKPAGVSGSLKLHGPPPEASSRVVYHVKLDSLGHFLIEAWRGEDRFETGLKGLPHWVSSGLLRPPRAFHLDPLQRHLEMDGETYPCDKQGAVRLEAILNSNYSPKLNLDADVPVSVRENQASPTGFDIHFWLTQAGARFEIKGHLNQERLDVLQDPVRCGLLRTGTILRISPPKLLIRRRRGDGGEESVPGVPDLAYLKANAIELQNALNHPSIRRERAGAAASLRPVQAKVEDSGFVEIRLLKLAEDHRLLWMDCFHKDGKSERRAFTHHNIHDLNSGHHFRTGLDVNLSLDHRTLSVLELESGKESHLVLDQGSSDTELLAGSALLTNALQLKSASDLKAG